MTGFFIKKAFFDGWDHLWSLVALNLGFLLLAGLLVLLPLSLEIPGTPVWLFLGVLVYFAYGVVCADALRGAVEYRDVNGASFLAALREQGFAGIVYGAAQACLAGLLVLAGSFYLTRGSIAGVFAFWTLFWFYLGLQLALQWLPAVRTSLPGSWHSVIRKCFLIMADNFGFSAFLFLYSLIGFALSAFSAFIIPGVSGIQLGTVAALRLVLKRYDWLDEHPEARGKKIPWGEILAEERELVGKRTLKGMLFPWKYE